MLTLRHNGTDYIDFTPADLADHGVPAAVIDHALTEAIAAEGSRAIDAYCDGAIGNSASRATRYELKEIAANAYRAAGYPDEVPADVAELLSAEAQARHLTIRTLAELIINTAAGFRALSARAEAGRARCKTAAAAAVGIDAKRAAVRAVVADVIAG